MKKGRGIILISTVFVLLALLVVYLVIFMNHSTLKHKVYINDMGKKDFNEYIFYESLDNVGTDCIVVKADKKNASIDNSQTFKSTCYNVYDYTMFDRIENNSGLKRVDLLDYGQVFLYEKSQQYEVMVLNRYDNEKFRIISYKPDTKEVNDITVGKKLYGNIEFLQSAQIDNNDFYIYSKDDDKVSIIKIDLEGKEETEYIEIDNQKFENAEFQLKYACIFIADEEVYIWNGDKGEHETVEEYEQDKGTSVLYKYNLSTKKMISNNVEGILWKLVKRENEIVGLRTEFRNLYLDSYTNDLKLKDSVDLDITQNNSLTVEFSVIDEYFYVDGNLLCGTVSDRKRRDVSYTTIIDMDKKKIVYLASTKGTRGEFGKIYNWYCKDNGEILNLY